MTTHRFQDFRRAAQHARRRSAYLNKVLANRFAIEHGVERRDFVYPHRLHFEQLRHIVHNADARPSFVLPLAEVEEGNDGCLFVLGRVMRDDIIGAFKILGCELKWNPRIVVRLVSMHKERV